MRALKSDERELWHETMRGVKRMRRAKPAAETPKPAPAEPKAKARRAAPSISPQPAPKKPVMAKPADALDRRTAQKLKRGAMPIEARLDLHGMTQSEAHEALTKFLARAQKNGARAVIVITGKSGVLHGAVPHWLDEGDNRGRVLASSRADVRHGGAGALYLLLRRKK